MKFIQLTVKSYQIMHGFDKENKEILETMNMQNSSVKLIAINRIQSISEKFVLTTYADRLIYWEYEEKYEEIVSLLEKSGCALIIK